MPGQWANGHEEEDEGRSLRAILRVTFETMLGKMAQCSLAKHWTGRLLPVVGHRDTWLCPMTSKGLTHHQPFLQPLGDRL